MVRGTYSKGQALPDASCQEGRQGGERKGGGKRSGR